jgi:hypothetical protein
MAEDNFYYVIKNVNGVATRVKVWSGHKKAKEKKAPEGSISTTGDTLLRYPSKIGADGDGDEPWIRYEIFKFTPNKESEGKAGGSGFQNKPVTSDIIHTIAMPFDQQIAMTNQQKWDPAGQRAGMMDNISAGGFFDGIGQSIKEGVSDTVSKGARMGTTGSAAGEALTDKVALKYEGPEQRSFTLTHTMIPKNPNEQINIQNIIQMFRYSSAPEFKMGTSTAQSYGFPNLFKISWMMGSKPNRNLPHYDIAYMSSVAVNYGDDNFSRFEGGAPTVYEMTLSFTEMEFINKEHIERNFR